MLSAPCKSRRQAGITLIEILISLVVGLIVLTAVVGVMVSSNKTNVDSLRMTHLNQELRAVMSLMTRDIRRSSYLGDWAARVTVNAAASPKDNVGNFTRVRIPQAGCVLYSYDADADATLDANENTGFRFNGGAVERGINVTDCNAGNWTGITDPQTVTITALTFTLYDTEQCIESSGGNNTGGVHKKELQITLTGQLVSDATVTRTIVDGVRPRNDDYQIHAAAPFCANATTVSP